MKSVWAVFGPDKEQGGAEDVLEVFTTEKAAEQWLGSGVFTAGFEVLRNLKPGGTFSLLMTRGAGDIRMSGSFAITNPDGERTTQDWRVEEMKVGAE